MERDNLIDSVRRDRKIYFLSRRGSDLIGVEKQRLKQAQIDHAIMRNELRSKLNYPKDWRNEVPIKINGEVFVVADAVYSEGGRIYFVEIDNKMSMQSNNHKIKRYAEIIHGLNRPATLGWYTLVESRKEKLRENCAKAGIDCRIF